MTDANCLRVIWEMTCNQDIAILHVDYRLFKWQKTDCEDFDADEDCTGLTDNQRNLITDLHNVHGVCALATNTYTITLYKGRVFSWEDVKARVEQVVRVWAGLGTVDRVTLNRREIAHSPSFFSLMGYPVS